MTDHNFTDDDVIKALEICANNEPCEECPYNRTQCRYLPRDASDLIYRQKAENERLNKEVDRLSQCVLYHDGIVSDLEKDVFNAKTEAIKEFADKVIDLIYEADDINAVSEWQIRNLVKEMTEGKNES